MTDKPLIVIVGPTASGKSTLAMRIAKKYNGEIVCADSRTVYKGMDIGTAKPTVEEQAEIPHHLIDIIEPSEAFSAAKFKQLAQEMILDILKRGKLPIMVGGTGLYVDAVLFDYTFGDVADKIQREKYNNLSIEQLREIGREKHINFSANSQNKRHLVRVLENGGAIKEPHVLREDTLVVGITTDKANLQRRIIKRTEQMLKDGILDEVRQLGTTYGWESEAMTGNIYRTFKGVVTNESSLETAILEVIRSDLNLAKRQITWFKRNPHIFWNEHSEDLMKRIDQFMLKPNK